MGKGQGAQSFCRNWAENLHLCLTHLFAFVITDSCSTGDLTLFLLHRMACLPFSSKSLTLLGPEIASIQMQKKAVPFRKNFSDVAGVNLLNVFSSSLEFNEKPRVFFHLWTDR